MYYDGRFAREVQSFCLNYLIINPTTKEGVGVVGERTRTRSQRHVKRGGKDPVRYDKETDRYYRTEVSFDHNYSVCGKDQPQNKQGW